MMIEFILVGGCAAVLLLPIVLMAAWTENTKTGRRFMDWLMHKTGLED
jgi:hypothetical protein